MLKNYGLFFLLFATYTIKGQVLSVYERFSTPYDKACVPYTIHITETDNLGNVGKTYKYEEGATETLDTFYTYTEPGRYAIIQLLAEDIDPKFDTLFIDLFEPLIPDYELFWCDENSFYLLFNQDFYDGFQVFTDSDTFLVFTSELVITNSSNPGNLKVEGILAGGFENCGVINESIEIESRSEPVEITGFSTSYICENNFDLHIDLEPQNGLFYEFELAAEPENFLISIGSINQENLKIPNISIAEGLQEFCFRINTINQCNGTKNPGNWNCQSINDQFRAIQYAYCSFQNKDVVIDFEENPNGSFQINRLIEGEIISRHENVRSGFKFSQVNPLRRLNFELIFTPNCLATSDTFSLAPPYLSAHKIDKNNYRLNITEPQYWSPYTPFRQMDLNGVNGSIPIATNPTTETFLRLERENGKNQSMIYTITFTTQGGFSTTDNYLLQSNTINLEFEQVVYVPSAFSPNGDALNDVIEIFGMPSQDFTWRIFNKWGELAASIVNDVPAWDGKLQNGKIIAGVYTYTLEYRTVENELFQQQGSFVLIK